MATRVGHGIGSHTCSVPESHAPHSGSPRTLSTSPEGRRTPAFQTLHLELPVGTLFGVLGRADARTTVGGDGRSYASMNQTSIDEGLR
jgi:hypothetical protein